MHFHLLSVLLFPLLYVQGRYARKTTPQLPEPEGHRSGEAGQGPELSLLIAGDSAAAGVGAGLQDEALAGNLVAALSRTHAVRWNLIAKSGDASADLLRALRSAPAARFETIVVSIGVNDVTRLTTARRWVRNLQEILDVSRAKFGARRILLSSVPPMQYFYGLPHPLRWWLGRRALGLNAHMKSVAQRNPDSAFVAIPYPADRDYLASDGFHPGPRAYQFWAEHLAGVIRERPE